MGSGCNSSVRIRPSRSLGAIFFQPGVNTYLAHGSCQQPGRAIHREAAEETAPTPRRLWLLERTSFPHPRDCANNHRARLKAASTWGSTSCSNLMAVLRIQSFNASIDLVDAFYVVNQGRAILFSTIVSATTSKVRRERIMNSE